MDLERLFYPKSIAVIGASPNVAGGKFPFFQTLKAAGYKGDLYPVNPAHKEIYGTKVYQSIEDLPAGVDLAIVQVPVRKALDTITSASKKGIKFVHFFTSGFSEIGDVELEQAMIRRARAGGARIVGPNCIGVFSYESRVTFGGLPDQDGPGNVAFLGQSGGVTLNFRRMAESRKLGLNKMISYGNQIDLHAEDYIEYFSR
ncbi:MAG: CoA-binding protein, partial [Deltaproteobacteria bacterium]|nr:CoA-binding protein [Deltaproteobacteria bacterium]